MIRRVARWFGMSIPRAAWVVGLALAGHHRSAQSIGINGQGFRGRATRADLTRQGSW